MKNRKGEEAKRWFAQALQDLNDAKYNLSGKRYNIACFLSQQSAEKALKSYLILKGADEIWGHSTSDLCRDAKSLEPAFSALAQDAASLDKYYIPTRYPNALPGGIPSEVFDEDDAQRAISLAEKVLSFVQSKSTGQL